MINKSESNHLKGIAILLVMLGHLVSSQYIHLPKEFRYFATFSVAIFLMLSGYGLTKSFIDNGLNNFIKKRLLSVYLPFLLANIILFFSFQRNQHSIEELITTISFTNLKLTIDGTMWFIYFILIWYVFFFITFSIKTPNSIRIIILFSLSTLLYKYSYMINSDTLSFQFSLHSFSFPIGVAIALLPSIELSKNTKAIMATISLCLFIIIIESLWGKYNFHLYALCSISFALTLILLIKEFNLNSKILSFMGVISYEAYLLEGVLRHVKYHENLAINTILFLSIVIISSIILNKTTKISIKKINNILKLNG